VAKRKTKRAAKAKAKPAPAPNPAPSKGGRPLAVDSEEVVAAALRSCKGYLYLTAARLRVTTRTVENYLIRWPALREIVEEEQGSFLDLAELSLMTEVGKGTGWAICFLLKTKGKKRGYVEKQQIEHGEIGATEVQEEVLASREDARADPTDQAAS
jgi:hypothetical protein